VALLVQYQQERVSSRPRSLRLWPFVTPVVSVFDLLGMQENDLTAALGFTLARSRRLLDLLIQTLDLPAGDGPVVVRMETADEAGRTDLELQTADHLVVVEAKRGWRLPESAQLTRYAARVAAHGGGMLVTLSDCSPAYADLKLPAAVEGVDLRHLSWANLKTSISTARTRSGGKERYWLTELGEYLRRAVRVTDPASSLAFCVSLSTGRPGDGGSRTFIDFAANEGMYFHPFGWGHGWPTDPPNFLTFRWSGHVQQVRRAEKHEVIPNLQTLWPDVPVEDDTSRPFSVYTLGPPLPMHGPLPTGTNYRANHLWVLVDQLLTKETLKDALAATKALTG
jgi:hypothetical protein